MSAAGQISWDNSPQQAPQIKWDEEKKQQAPPQQDSAIKRYAGSISPILTQNPADTLKATAEEVKHPKETAVNVAKGMNPYAGEQDAANIALEQMKQPGIGNKVAGGIRYLAAGIPFIGPSLVKAGEQAKAGDYAGMAGTITPIAAGAALSPTGRGAIGDAATAVKEAPGKVRGAIGEAAHDSRTGKLTPTARAIGRGGGIMAGGGLGEVVGHPYAGGVVGYSLGPTLLEKAFPEPENVRMGRIQSQAQAINSKLARGKSSPFSLEGNGKVGVPEEDESRSIILPGEEIDPMRRQSAGSAAQATEGDLRRLAAAGDKSAAAELVRRRLPVNVLRNYANVPLPRGR
jgi:hypothetical protein